MIGRKPCLITVSKHARARQKFLFSRRLHLLLLSFIFKNNERINAYIYDVLWDDIPEEELSNVLEGLEATEAEDNCNVRRIHRFISYQKSEFFTIFVIF